MAVVVHHCSQESWEGETLWGLRSAMAVVQELPLHGKDGMLPLEVEETWGHSLLQNSPPLSVAVVLRSLLADVLRCLSHSEVE